MINKQRKFYLFLALTAILAATLACSFPGGRSQTQESLPTIPVSTEAVTELEQNVEAAAQAAATGGPVTVQITEAQLTSLVAFYLQGQSDYDIQDPQVYLRDGQIQLVGKLRQSGITAPLKIVLEVTVDDQGQPHYEVVSATVGPLPLPQSILDQLTTQLDQALAGQLNPQTNGMVIEEITIQDGVMTINGHTR